MENEFVSYSSGILFWVLVLFLLIYFTKKILKGENSLKRFSEEKQREIIREIKENYGKAFDEARKEYPVGKALIGKLVKLQREVIVKLSSEPAFIKDSFKIPARKIPAGEDIKILDIDWNSNNYIIQTKGVERGYVEFKEADDELFNKRIDKQSELQSGLFNKYFEEIVKKYNLSKDEASIIENKVTLEILQRKL